MGSSPEEKQLRQTRIVCLTHQNKCNKAQRLRWQKEVTAALRSQLLANSVKPGSMFDHPVPLNIPARINENCVTTVGDGLACQLPTLTAAAEVQKAASQGRHRAPSAALLASKLSKRKQNKNEISVVTLERRSLWSTASLLAATSPKSSSS